MRGDLISAAREQRNDLIRTRQLLRIVSGDIEVSAWAGVIGPLYPLLSYRVIIRCGTDTSEDLGNERGRSSRPNRSHLL